jgi:hypothetical protein
LTNKSIQIGQIWRSEATGENWLVTKTYTELFTSYAVLRKIGGRDSDVRHLRVERSPEGPALSGFSLVEESV